VPPDLARRVTEIRNSIQQYEGLRGAPGVAETIDKLKAQLKTLEEQYAGQLPGKRVPNVVRDAINELEDQADIAHELGQIDKSNRLTAEADELRRKHFPQEMPSGEEMAITRLSERTRVRGEERAARQKEFDELIRAQGGGARAVERWRKELAELEPAIEQAKAGKPGAYPTGVYLVPSDVAKDFVRAGNAMDNPGRFMKMINWASHWWAGQVTVQKPGFHIRNFFGNVFNSMLYDPRVTGEFARASRIRSGGSEAIVPGTRFTERQVHEMSLMTGVDKPGGSFIADLQNPSQFNRKMAEFDYQIEQARLSGKFATPEERAAEIAKIKALKDRELFGGFTGVAEDDAIAFRRLTRDPQKWADFIQSINPSSNENAWARFARVRGSDIENHSRVALFTRALRNGLDPTQAAEVVGKYLFHYDELSRSLQQAKRWVPFMTWLRNNLPLQAENILTQPGKYETAFKAIGATGPPTDRPTELPVYLRDPLTWGTPFRPGGRPVTVRAELPVADILNLGDPPYGSQLPVIGRNLSPVVGLIADTLNHISGEDPKAKRVAAPEVINWAFQSLPNSIRKSVGLEDFKSTVTGQPVVGMDPHISNFLRTAFPMLLQDISRLIPTPENLARPTYAGGVTSALTGVRVDWIDPQLNQAYADLNYQKMLRGIIDKAAREGYISYKDANRMKYQRRSR
jgi:hypothetical protein